MKTYEIVQRLKNGDTVDLGSSPVGSCKVRRTKKGAIASNSNGNRYVKDADFAVCFGNLNAIGLQSIVEHSTRSAHPA